MTVNVGTTVCLGRPRNGVIGPVCYCDRAEVHANLTAGYSTCDVVPSSMHFVLQLPLLHSPV